MYSITSPEDPDRTQTLRRIWARMSLGERRDALPPTVRVRDLSPRERLQGLTPEQLVRHLSPEEREAIRRLL